MVPMTLISFIADRPPAPSGVAITFMCTTVSTSADAITLAMIGLRMSARTNSTPDSAGPESPFGGTTSTPMTFATLSSAASIAATRPPSARETPVTRTTRAATRTADLLLVAPLDARLLQQLAVLLLRHPLAALLDNRTHEIDLARDVT